MDNRGLETAERKKIGSSTLAFAERCCAENRIRMKREAWDKKECRKCQRLFNKCLDCKEGDLYEHGPYERFKRQKGHKKSVSFKPKGFRDIIWCPFSNEPEFLGSKDGKPNCPGCNGNWEPENHPFIVHILKPQG